MITQYICSKCRGHGSQSNKQSVIYICSIKGDELGKNVDKLFACEQCKGTGVNLAKVDIK